LLFNDLDLEADPSAISGERKKDLQPEPDEVTLDDGFPLNG
jgi:hypothetical protein